MTSKHGQLGSPDMLVAMDAELKGLLDRQIAELNVRIEQTIASDNDLAAIADVLRSVAEIGPGASTMLIAEMPELGQLSGEQAAALAGLAPIAHDSGSMRGKRAIGGGRRKLRHVMFHADLVASHHNPILKTFADRLRAAGKPHKVVITAVARKLVTIANGLCKHRQK
ncbi:transposase [Maritimibacter alkaliphilus]|uniref:transposase n=1 Tax=Maritimibacter alkaliphilus TaxID=404236 RepID=UPI00319E4B34